MARLVWDRHRASHETRIMRTRPEPISAPSRSRGRDDYAPPRSTRERRAAASLQQPMEVPSGTRPIEDVLDVVALSVQRKVDVIARSAPALFLLLNRELSKLICVQLREVAPPVRS